eukprot:7240660-Prymnesium_polylepis.1
MSKHTLQGTQNGQRSTDLWILKLVRRCEQITSTSLSPRRYTARSDRDRRCAHALLQRALELVAGRCGTSRSCPPRDCEARGATRRGGRNTTSTGGRNTTSAGGRMATRVVRAPVQHSRAQCNTPRAWHRRRPRVSAPRLAARPPPPSPIPDSCMTDPRAVLAPVWCMTSAWDPLASLKRFARVPCSCRPRPRSPR